MKQALVPQKLIFDTLLRKTILLFNLVYILSGWENKDFLHIMDLY